MPVSVCGTDHYRFSITAFLIKLQKGWAIKPKFIVCRDYWKRPAVLMITVSVTGGVLQKQNHKAVRVEDTSYIDSNKKYILKV